MEGHDRLDESAIVKHMLMILSLRIMKLERSLCFLWLKGTLVMEMHLPRSCGIKATFLLRVSLVETRSISFEEKMFLKFSG